MKVKEENDKADIKLDIQKTKIMVFGPITLWQIEEETMETMTDFIFLGSKTTAQGKKICDKPRQHIQKAETFLCHQSLV